MVGKTLSIMESMDYFGVFRGGERCYRKGKVYVQ